MWCCMVTGDLWVWVMTTASAWFSFAVGSGVAILAQDPVGSWALIVHFGSRVDL